MTNSTVTVSQLICCGPGDAFDAFANPAKITRFWLASTSAALTKNGTAMWHFLVPGAAEQVTVDEFEPSDHFAISWSDGSQFRLEFSEISIGKTRVSVEFQISAHDPIQQVVSTAEGFSIVLCDLKTLLESGQSANLVRAKAELIGSYTDPP